MTEEEISEIHQRTKILTEPITASASASYIHEKTKISLF